MFSWSCYTQFSTPIDTKPKSIVLYWLGGRAEKPDENLGPGYWMVRLQGFVLNNILCYSAQIQTVTHIHLKNQSQFFSKWSVKGKNREEWRNTDKTKMKELNPSSTHNHRCDIYWAWQCLISAHKSYSTRSFLATFCFDWLCFGLWSLVWFGLTNYHRPNLQIPLPHWVRLDIS